MVNQCQQWSFQSQDVFQFNPVCSTVNDIADFIMLIEHERILGTKTIVVFKAFVTFRIICFELIL